MVSRPKTCSWIQREVRVLPVPHAISNLARSWDLSASTTAAMAGVWCGRGESFVGGTAGPFKSRWSSFSFSGHTTVEISSVLREMRSTELSFAILLALSVKPFDVVMYILPKNLSTGEAPTRVDTSSLLMVVSGAYALHCTAHRRPCESVPTRSTPRSGPERSDQSSYRTTVTRSYSALRTGSVSNQ